MDEYQLRQSIIDEEHLRLLSIFHYISGAITLAISLFIFVEAFLFFSIFSRIADYGTITSISFDRGRFDPMFFSMFRYIFIVIFIITFIFGIAQIFSGKFLRDKTHKTFSFVIAIICLLSFPYGTILGVMTIIVLNRNSVVELYRKKQQESMGIQI